MYAGSDEAIIIIAWYALFYKPVIIILIFAIFPLLNHQIVAAPSIKLPNSSSKALGDVLG